MKQYPFFSSPTRLNVALQGGGAHGAFTWGVLDRLLEEETLRFNAVSGTSAGAMNAAALISGLENGGAEAARQSLRSFWRSVSSRSRLIPFNRSTVQAVLSGLGLDVNALPFFFGSGSYVFSPYDLNPAGFNPLQEIIRDTIDMAALSRSSVALYVTATHVGTGEARVFSGEAVTENVLLASACLPALFHAIEIDGEHFWDGGYSGNPSLMPLVGETGASDLLLVQTSPTERPDLPQKAQQIAAREKEISFNAPLIKELRLLAELQNQARMLPGSGAPGFLESLVGKLTRQKPHVARSISSLKCHRITSAAMNVRDSQTKLDSAWLFLTQLRDEGRHAAEMFLKTHGRDLGRRSTLDLSRWLHGTAANTGNLAKAS